MRMRRYFKSWDIATLADYRPIFPDVGKDWYTKSNAKISNNMVARAKPFPKMHAGVHFGILVYLKCAAGGTFGQIPAGW